MSREKQGSRWTQYDDDTLRHLFRIGFNYEEMGNKLKRSWYACKCRCARLGLIPEIVSRFNGAIISQECEEIPNKNYRIPNKWNVIPVSTIEVEDWSDTFCDIELDVLEDWLKHRIAKLCIQMCYTQDEECLKTLKNIKTVLKNELEIVASARGLDLPERKRNFRKV